METYTVSIKLPKNIIEKLKKKGKPSRIIKKIVIQTFKEEKKKIIEEIKKIKVRKDKSKANVTELIREDRDILH